MYENNLKKISELKTTYDQLNKIEEKLSSQLDTINKNNVESFKLINEISGNYKIISKNLI